MEPRKSTGLAATKLHILDRPLSRGKSEVRRVPCEVTHTLVNAVAGWWWMQVSLSAFAFLFSEMVQYFQSRVQNISDLESRCRSEVCTAVGVWRCAYDR